MHLRIIGSDFSSLPPHEEPRSDRSLSRRVDWPPLQRRRRKAQVLGLWALVWRPPPPAATAIVIFLVYRYCYRYRYRYRCRYTSMVTGASRIMRLVVGVI